VCAVLLARSLLTFHRSFPLSAHSPSRLPLLRFSKDRPSAVHLRESSPSSPFRRMVRLRSSAATHRTPSALVVPPDYDGLLLTKPRRFVAPCIQPWGSSRFQPRLQPPVSRPVAVLVAFPVLALHTLRSVPLIDSQPASPLVLCLLVVGSVLPPPLSTPKCFVLLLPLASCSRSLMLPPVCAHPSPAPRPRGLAPSLSPLPLPRVAT